MTLLEKEIGKLQIGAVMSWDLNNYTSITRIATNFFRVDFRGRVTDHKTVSRTKTFSEAVELVRRCVG